jgi:hypothetical protein
MPCTSILQIQFFRADFDLLREINILRAEASAPSERGAQDAVVWNCCDSKRYLQGFALTKDEGMVNIL